MMLLWLMFVARLTILIGPINTAGIIIGICNLAQKGNLDGRISRLRFCTPEILLTEFGLKHITVLIVYMG